MSVTKIDFSDYSKIVTHGYMADEVKLFFKRDTWNKDEAMFLIGGVFPIKYLDMGYSKLNGGGLYYGEQDVVADYIQSILDIYKSNPENPDIAPPQYFIEWAFQKEISIPWLDFAIDQGFYKPKQLQEVEKLSNPSFDNTYSTDLIYILNLTVKAFFNPRKNVDPKKEAVTEWIKAKGQELKINVSDNVADTIFTIIKPNDHNPKRKRA